LNGRELGIVAQVMERPKHGRSKGLKPGRGQKRLGRGRRAGARIFFFPFKYQGYVRGGAKKRIVPTEGYTQRKEDWRCEKVVEFKSGERERRVKLLQVLQAENEENEKSSRKRTGQLRMPGGDTKINRRLGEQEKEKLRRGRGWNRNIATRFLCEGGAAKPSLVPKGISFESMEGSKSKVRE